MAMINCPECGKEVSDKAKTCPNCGAPIAPQKEFKTEEPSSQPLSYRYRKMEDKSKTQICKHCKSEIPKDAKVCPVCKRNIKGGHGCLMSILIFIIILCGGFAAAINMNDSVQKSVSGVTDTSEYITLDEYNQINTGMSYEEVKAIVGSEGTVSSEAESNGYKIVIVTWYGNGTAGSNANVTFTNDKVTAKAQIGLQ